MVTEQSLAQVLQTMKVCADEPEVLIEGLKALNNFVYLNGERCPSVLFWIVNDARERVMSLAEDMHMYLTERKVLKVVRRLIENFHTDKEVMEVSEGLMAVPRFLAHDAFVST
jgi:hypothetical protein